MVVSFFFFAGDVRTGLNPRATDGHPPANNSASILQASLKLEVVGRLQLGMLRGGVF